VLEDQLERLTGEADRPMRARILATLGCELYYTDRHVDGERFSRQGIELARQLGDAELLGFALTNYWTAARQHHRDAEGRAATEETLALAGKGLPKRIELTARMHHLNELARSGDLADYDVELSRCKQLAAELHSPEVDGQLGWAEASRAIFDARWDDAERIGAQAYEQMRHTSAPGSEWSRLAGRVTVARGRGRLGELADELRRCVEPPEFHMFRAAVSLAYAQAGQIEVAQELAERWAEPPADDWTWMMPMAYWAEVSTLIGVPDPQWVHDAIEPYSGQLAVVGTALDCGGAVDSLLAGLNARLGRSDAALRYARDGLRMERRAGLRAWIPRTTQLVMTLETP